MFIMDPSDRLKFVLEFNLPKEISDNQEHIELLVHHIEVPTVEIPACPIGYTPRTIKIPGEIHCIEHYKSVKGILPLINRWTNSVYSACNNLSSSRSNLLVEAKLYAYKNDQSLFKKWNLIEFYPLYNYNSYMYANDNLVGLKFKFEDAIRVKTMIGLCKR